MNRQIRGVGRVLVALFVLLILQITWIQSINADRYRDDPANTARRIAEEFERERGSIVSGDGVVIAESVPSGRDVYSWARAYPEGNLLGHVTGYHSLVFGNGYGERSWDDQLLGEDTPLTFSSVIDRLEGDLQGNDVTLSIDSRVQAAAARALDSRAGSVVALDPRDGSVLAVYSNPTYDPSPISALDPELNRAAWDAYESDPDNPMLARAFRETFPPGSTFKVVTATALLESDPAVTTDTPFQARSSLPLPQTNDTISNSGGTCGGTLLVSFQRSCNTVFAQIALDVGGDTLVSTAEDFGFNQVPPFDLGAVRSVIPRQDWSVALPEVAKSGIGQQDVRATPLQMALVSAAVANDGEIMEPRVARKVIDVKGQVVVEYRPRVWKTAMSPETAADLQAMMRAVVAGGTGRAAEIPDVGVAGKTGTAETGTGPPHAWFIGYAPADDPRVAVAVLVENGGSGGRVAGPVARDVLVAALEALPD